MFQESSAGCSAQGPRLQNETVLCSDPGSASRSLTWSLSAPEVVLGELTEGIRRCFNKLGRTVHLQSLGELCSEPRRLWPSLLPFPGPCPYPSARWHHAVVILKTVQIFEHNLYAGPLPSPLTLSPTLCPHCLISSCCRTSPKSCVRWSQETAWSEEPYSSSRKSRPNCLNFPF